MPDKLLVDCNKCQATPVSTEEAAQLSTRSEDYCDGLIYSAIESDAQGFIEMAADPICKQIVGKKSLDAFDKCENVIEHLGHELQSRSRHDIEHAIVDRLSSITGKTVSREAIQQGLCQGAQEFDQIFKDEPSEKWNKIKKSHGL